MLPKNKPRYPAKGTVSIAFCRLRNTRCRTNEVISEKINNIMKDTVENEKLINTKNKESPIPNVSEKRFLSLIFEYKKAVKISALVKIKFRRML